MTQIRPVSEDEASQKPLHAVAEGSYEQSSTGIPGDLNPFGFMPASRPVHNNPSQILSHLTHSPSLGPLQSSNFLPLNHEPNSVFPTKMQRSHRYNVLQPLAQQSDPTLPYTESMMDPYYANSNLGSYVPQYSSAAELDLGSATVHPQQSTISDHHSRPALLATARINPLPLIPYSMPTAKFQNGLHDRSASPPLRQLQSATTGAWDSSYGSTEDLQFEAPADLYNTTNLDSLNQSAEGHPYELCTHGYPRNYQ